MSMGYEIDDPRHEQVKEDFSAGHWAGKASGKSPPPVRGLRAAARRGIRV